MSLTDLSREVLADNLARTQAHLRAVVAERDAALRELETLRRYIETETPKEVARAEAERDVLAAENKRLRGWPDIEVGRHSPAHSPVDSYRCEGGDEAEEPHKWVVWQFRPDDYDLDEKMVLCPECGQEGELFYRRFRGGGAVLPIGSPR